MLFNKISMFVLSLVLSCDALMAGPVMRAGALRLNSNSTTSSKSSSTASSNASVGALATYERASRLRPNRVQVSSSSASSTVNQEILNKVYEEMSRVTNAVEQELYITQREIDKLKDEIAEKNDKISELEDALAEYEEVKTTVKNIPNIYYSKKEVDAKGYVMPKTLESAITSAKADAREAAVEEINRKGFITADTVSANIANAKTAAIADAVAEIEKRNFATVSSVDNKIANLELGVNETAVANIVENKLTAKDFATNTALRGERTARENALKEYATISVVEDRINNLDLGVDETAVANIVENKLTAKDFATNTALQSERTARENALKEYATKEEVEGVDNKFKDISETVAVDLAKNDNFKAQVLSSLDTSISELPSKVTAVENRLATMNNQLFDDEQKPVFVKKPELDTLITVDLIDSKLPTTVCKTKDCLTATIGDHYTTNSTVVSKIDTAKAELNSAITAAKGEAIDGAVAQAGTVFLKSSDLANNATIVTLNNKFKDYTTTADLNNTVGGLAVIKALPTSDAVNSAIDAAKTTVINDAAGKYATTAALNNVDGKFQNYTTTANLGNVEVIKTMQGNIAANTTKITTNTNKFSNYTTTDTMNSAIADAKTYADGKAEAAKTAAIAQAATDSNTAITTAKTEINNTINTVKNAVIGIAGNAAVKFDNVSAPDCTSSGCSIKSEYKPGGAM